MPEAIDEVNHPLARLQLYEIKRYGMSSVDPWAMDVQHHGCGGASAVGSSGRMLVHGRHVGCLDRQNVLDAVVVVR